MRVLIVCLALLVACANEPRTITAPEGGGRVSVIHGDRLLIRLPDPAGGEWVKREPATRTVIEEWPPEPSVRRFTPVTSGTQELRFEQGTRVVTYEVVVPDEGRPVFARR
ncbi:MAG: hypothetical protein ACT4P4_30025 [Betaproteobacteria bacterium]